MKYVMCLEWLTVHILLVPWMRVNQSSKQKINLYFFVWFVCVNYKKLLALMLWKGTLSYVSFWTNNVMNEILSKDGYCHTEDTSLQNNEEYKFVMAINWNQCLCLSRIAIIKTPLKIRGCMDKECSLQITRY